MDDFTIRQDIPADQTDARTVIISGQMTIQHGEEIKAALLSALANGDSISLDLQKVTEIDLSGFQTICASHRTSIALGKVFSLDRSGNQPISQAVQALGFSRHTGCRHDSGNTCVWAKGE